MESLKTFGNKLKWFYQSLQEEEFWEGGGPMDLGEIPGQASMEVTIIELSHRPQSTPQQQEKAAASEVKTDLVFRQGLIDKTELMYKTYARFKPEAITAPENIMESITVPEAIMEIVTVPEAIMEAVTVPEAFMEAVDVPEVTMDAERIVTEPAPEATPIAGPAPETTHVAGPAPETTHVTGPELKHGLLPGFPGENR